MDPLGYLHCRRFWRRAFELLNPRVPVAKKNAGALRHWGEMVKTCYKTCQNMFNKSKSTVSSMDRLSVGPSLIPMKIPGSR